MAASWLSQWSDAARLAYPGIVRGVREGLSARAIGRALRGAGLSISNDALFAIARRERDVWTHGQSLRYLNPESAPNPFRLPESLTALTRSFAFTVEVRGTLLDTGARTRQYITISTNDVMTRRELEELAAEIASGQPLRYGIDVEDAVLVGGIKAGTLGTL